MSGKFVAVGAGKIATSPDGTTWTQQTTPGGTFRAVCFSPSLNLWVAVGDVNKVVTSPDGTSWTDRTGVHIDAGTPSPIEGVCWAEELGLFIAVGGSGLISTSPDGVSWTLRADYANNFRFLDVAWSGSLAVAWGTDTTGVPAIVYKSSDAVNWSDADPAPKSINGSGEGIVYASGLGLWVGVTTFRAHRSSDMTTQPYANVDVGIGTNLAFVEWSSGLGQLLTGTSAGALATSTNATAWTARTSTFGTTGITAAEWSPELSLWVIVGGSGKLATSPDGVTWTAGTSSFGTTQINGVAWGASARRGWVVGSATMN